MFVTHLESALDGARLPADTLHTTHRDKPLWVRYDLKALGNSISKKELKEREPTLWRYREFLPVPKRARPVSLGEIITPLIQAEPLGHHFGVKKLWLKDESRLPTGSFKSRGMALAITMARHFGVKKIALPTAGNAGAAAAAYAAIAGMEAYVFMPEDTPKVNQIETILYGARAFLVNGLITDCGRIVREGTNRLGWHDLSTLREPYRIEGKKTMGLELAEQFNWKLPDVIIYPTGGGTGLIGMWKAFKELRELDWLENTTMPRLVAVQSDGCCPIVKAFEAGRRFAEPFPNAHTVASGIRVPSALGDFMILDAIRESGGTAVAVEEGRIIEWLKLASQMAGLSICPESAACIGALEKLVSEKWLKPDESVIVFNTASALKYIEKFDIELPQIDIKKEISWETIASYL